jgi:hypothetical protein
MEQILKSQTKVVMTSQDLKSKVCEYMNLMKQEDIEEFCPAILNTLLSKEKGLLKNELGRIIFQLQKTEQLNSRFALEKLVEGALIAAPEDLFRLFGTLK